MPAKVEGLMGFRFKRPCRNCELGLPCPDHIDCKGCGKRHEDCENAGDCGWPNYCDPCLTAIKVEALR